MAKHEFPSEQRNVHVWHTTISKIDTN